MTSVGLSGVKESGGPSPEFFSLCRQVGAHIPFWTQGPGGNISEKVGEVLWIKASGVRLDQVAEIGVKQVAAIDLGAFADELHCLGVSDEDAYARLLQKTVRSDLSLARPSMEAAFHALLPGRFVCHFHALSALLMSHVATGEPAAWRKFCEEHGQPLANIAMIEVLSPGLKLAKAIASRPRSPFYLLSNHGVILQGADGGVLTEWTAFETAFLARWRFKLSGVHPLIGPLKIYFPDTAVFFERLLAILMQKDDGTFAPNQGAATRDLDVYEIWQATQMLYHACPDLSEIGAAIAADISQLPTEKFRQMRIHC